uniref:Spectrin beta chain n=1 Tax=Globodera rostochiensis TaxID=31243 RepID=A0A914HJH5_GLORO
MIDQLDQHILNADLISDRRAKKCHSRRFEQLLAAHEMTTDIAFRGPMENGAHTNAGGEYGDEYDDNSSSKLFERHRIKALADERENVQKKTFTKWVNSHLIRVNCKIQDLYVDLRDGKMLIKLLEVLSGDRLPRPTRGKMRIHCLENVDKGLQFLRDQHVHLENLGSQDIVDGAPRLTLGLVWTVILRFQIQDITFEDVDNQETRSAKEALLLWCQMKTAGYRNVNVRNFTSSWRDGLAFNALIHKHRSDLVEYDGLQKSNALHNLNNAFDVAEKQLGLAKLLDAEDVNVEQPDEKSIITYVVTYYHYFNKLKQEGIQGKRIGKVIAELMENEALVEKYEQLSSALLEWIRAKIGELNDRQFANSLRAVQQQLTGFNVYRMEEKPPRFQEKGELEMLLFSLLSRMRANNQRAFLPREGRTIGDINKAWRALERAEHERELALKEELIRQEKLEQLATRFDKKAGMRETWLGENQRLVSQDNFGSDLASVEAANKKHEAIETDIYAYEERVQAVVAVASELEAEQYHDIGRINERKQNVLALWRELLELLAGRRLRLELSLAVQRVFHDMLNVLDQMDELRTKLDTEELGQHLMDVEELLQKHALLESDLNIVADQIQLVNRQAERFTREDGPDGTGYKPVEPEVVLERMKFLEQRYQELLELAARRKANLEANKRLCQFNWDLTDLDTHFREQEQVLAQKDKGRDIVSVNRLLAKHKNAENNLADLGRGLDQLQEQGQQLVDEQIPGSGPVPLRLADTRTYYDHLRRLADERRKELEGAVEYYQFFHDADDVEAYLLDTLRVVSTDDVGHDESSVQLLLKKHDGVSDELESFDRHIQQLEAQAFALPEEARAHPDIAARLSGTQQRKSDLVEVARLRKQRLIDSLSLYKLLSDIDSVESWIDEKGKLLKTLIPGPDLEEVEIMKHRFDTLQNDMQSQAAKVQTSNELARQMLQVEHPNSDDILARQNALNARWAQLKDMVDQKRAELDRAHRMETFRIDCQETITWIAEKTRVLEDTDEMTGDLSGVMKLQRRLSMMERDLGAIQAKLDSLVTEANAIEREKPAEAAQIRENITRIQHVWDVLNRRVREQEAKLDEAGDLQRFLRDLDHFQAWLTATQRQVASVDEPQSLAEAEQLLQQHAAIKEEIDGYAEDYRKMRAMGDRVTQDQTDPQYMFLRERLASLEHGWKDLQSMWEQRQTTLSQGLSLQTFLQRAKQAEVILSQQENKMAREEQPASLEQAENLLKRHQDFMTTMEANDDKMRAVVQMGDQLCADAHYAADKVHKKARNIEERRAANREKAQAMLDKLREAVHVQQFLSDCEELREWIEEKMIRAQDETYRDAKTITSKFMRHQAFQAELAANKRRLEEIHHAAEQMAEEKPEFHDMIDPEVLQLSQQWEQLERTTEEKGQRLFDANRQQLYVQSIGEVKDWAQQVERQIGEPPSEPQDLTTVDLAMQRQQQLEQEMTRKVHHLESLQEMEPKLEEMQPEQLEQIKAHRIAITEQLQRLRAPLDERRRQLERKKAAFQFVRDVEDEKLWAGERMPVAESRVIGDSLFDCHRLQKNTQSLRNEVDNHEPWINEIRANGQELIDEGHENAPLFVEKLGELAQVWDTLKDAIDGRKQRLKDAERAHQYLYDCAEAEAWMSEQELYMMQDERGKDEFSTQNQIKRHERLQHEIGQFAETIRDLAVRVKELIDEGSPLSEQIRLRQAQIEKLYAGLQDLSKERRRRLEETLQLYDLHREIDDLLQWIADKEVVAGSHENGQDYEHVQMLQERFAQFARDTESIGAERVSRANGDCDRLISAAHSDSPTIALWKDSLNEAWENLLELIDTRAQMLEASRQMHKFFYDCRDCLARIVEKTHSLPEELGRDSSSVGTLSRKHQAFLKDIDAIGAQVAQIEGDAKRLRDAYAGERAMEIVGRENEVLKAWHQLRAACEARSMRLNDTSDLFRFMNMVRDLLVWIEEVKREMLSHERPRDVSGVELLMNNHQSLKAEIDTREENFRACLALGRQLLERNHYASAEVEKKLLKLTTDRTDMMHRWEDRWEYLRLILEVYQFARDAAVAEAWLDAQEPYLKSRNYGRNLEEVIALIKKHEAFMKSSAAQDERFMALEKFTNYELKEMQRRERALEEERRRRAGETPPKGGRAGETVFPASISGEAEPASRSHEGLLTAADTFEGVLIRKHNFEGFERRASHRAWEKLYTVLFNGDLYFFKDARHRQEQPQNTFRGEAPLQLAGCSVQPVEHPKRRHVLSMKWPFGSEFLLQCADEEDLQRWLLQLQQSAALRSGGGAQQQQQQQQSSAAGRIAAEAPTAHGVGLMVSSSSESGEMVAAAHPPPPPSAQQQQPPQEQPEKKGRHEKCQFENSPNFTCKQNTNTQLSLFSRFIPPK